MRVFTNVITAPNDINSIWAAPRPGYSIQSRIGVFECLWSTTRRGRIIKRTRQILIFVIVVVAIVALDQASKYMVETAVPLNRHVEVIPGYLDIVHVRNPGAAFGILAQSAWDWRKTFFVSVSGIALAVILWLVAFGVTPDLFLLGGYSLFFGGTLGNLIDRLRFGEVIDFLDVHVENLHWPAFNVADSALCVGAALFFIHIVRSSRTTRESLDTSA